MPRTRLTREERIDRHKRIVEEQLASCPQCEPWDEGDTVWVNGNRTNLIDLLNDCGVPQDEQFRDEVIESLRCPECGNAIVGWEDVGVADPQVIDHRKALHKALKRFGTELSDFTSFLEKAPTLGASHPVGRRLLKDMHAFPKTSLERGTWFRARRLESGRVFTPDDLRIPDSDSVLLPGRFNHLGQAYWYLASSDYTAVKEILGQGEEMAWFQKWIVNPIDPILDLVPFYVDDSDDASDKRAATLPLLATAMIFGGHLNRPVDRERGWKPEYFVPHYVADAAKLSGFKGIRFSSARAGGTNLVIFDRDAPVEADGEPEILNVKTYFKDSPF
jgi:hypothetical protein